ncbi:MAG: hypothetical protein JRI41_08115 [Deltaproteobacteria bacterium]|nr:hypothetical protein [Deltaproteobacteria bacterium]
MNKLKMRALIPEYDATTGKATVQLLSDYREAFAILHQRVKGAVWELTAGKWYRRRTTGWKSQNHHINGHVQQICIETGQDFETVKAMVKIRAIDAGYPFDVYRNFTIPKSEAFCNTQEAAMLIEAAHVIAAELGIILKEEDE